MKIIVNTISIEWGFESITYHDLLNIAMKADQGLMTIMVTYTKQDKKSRTITPGQSVDVIEGMIFEVVRTDNA